HSMSRMWLAAATAGALALGVSACGSSSNSTSSSSGTPSSGSSSVSATLNGSGSTFAAPIYQQLGSELKGKGLTINYQAVGSGQGVSDLTNKSTVFAGSDPPMKGEDVAAAAIKQTPGAIGYVEQAYALQNNFTYAYEKNSASKYVNPTLQSVTAAGAGISVPSDLRFTLVSSKDPNAYPISSQTF